MNPLKFHLKLCFYSNVIWKTNLAGHPLIYFWISPSIVQQIYMWIKYVTHTSIMTRYAIHSLTSCTYESVNVIVTANTTSSTIKITYNNQAVYMYVVIHAWQLSIHHCLHTYPTSPFLFANQRKKWTAPKIVNLLAISIAVDHITKMFAGDVSGIKLWSPFHTRLQWPL